MAVPLLHETDLITLNLPDEVSKPPSGVVLPPKDIRAIVEKTAGYVARNGPVFEERIREKEKHNPKFSFLSANDAYSDFYAWRLNEVKEGRGTTISAGRAGDAVLSFEPPHSQEPSQPPDFRFSPRMPNINAQDLDVIKLTALFVARNGRAFMTTLSQKESRNYQFDFLRPQHSLYQFFSRLIDQYTDILQAISGASGKAEKARSQELKANVTNRSLLLTRAERRAEWVKYQDKQKQKKAEEEEKERLEYVQIDWHDFVVVETVLFTEADDQVELPAPTSLIELQSASLEQKAAMSLQPSNMRIEEALPTDQDIYLTPPSQQPYPAQPSLVSLHNVGTPPQLKSMRITALSPPPSFQDDDNLHAIAERVEARDRAHAAQVAAKGGLSQPMLIRNDYVPRAQAKRQVLAMALCPNCKQQIPYNELDQHMRS